jgi:outer membrane receptor for ferrienterochelin and colicins
MISLAMYDVNKYSYFNVDIFKSIGYVINSEWKINDFKIGIGGTYTGRYNQLSESEIVKSYSWSPELRTNIGYVFPSSQLTVSLFYKYNGKIIGYAQDTEKQIYQTFIGDYHTADMSISKPLFNKRILLVLGSKNLLNVKTISSNTSSGAHSASSGTTSVGMGRTYFLKLDINLNKK